MKKRIFISALIGLFFLTNNGLAQGGSQEDIDAIKKAITTLFDGMRAGDSAMVHSVLDDATQMQRVMTNQAGETRVSSGGIQNFLNAVGTPHNEVWDEQITFGDIQIDDNLASVWTPFKFYRGKTFSHCGVNAFKLYKEKGKWYIFHLVDTNRRDKCIGD